MSSELSIFAARLRAFMDISLEELPQLDAASTQALAQHSNAEFNGMAMVLFALQFARNQPYRRLCEARGVTPNTVSHWSEIPAVPTAAFKELELTCLPQEQRTNVFHSSGTTEQRPSRHFHNAESLAIYEASLWNWLRGNLRLAIGDLRLLCLTPPTVQAPHTSLVHMFEVIRRELDADESAFVGRVGVNGMWTLDFDATLAVLTAADSRSLLVLGTAFSFVHLLDEMKARSLRIQLPDGSRAMETGGYKGRSRELSKAELHALITERLGVLHSHIVCEYGMSELSSQAYDCQTRSAECGVRTEAGVFHFPPWARAQIVSPESGQEVAEDETGLLRVFDLANVFSVMAIQTEDLAGRRGDGFDLIGRAKAVEPRGCSLMTA